MYRLRPVFDDRGFPDLKLHRELLRDVSVSHSIDLRLNVSYLPTLAGYPAGNFLPIRRNLDGVPL